MRTSPYDEKMLPVLLLGRAVLCAVFLIAGLSKLKDRAGSRQSFVEFGLPRALAGPLGIALPVCELIVAIALLPASFAWIGAIGAIVLLGVFILGIAANLLQGKKPDCHCFGQIHSKPIGWDLVARNAALAGVAGMVVYAGPRQPSFLALGGTSNQISGGPLFLAFAMVVLALLGFQSWLLYQLIQQGGRVLLRLDALEKQIGGTAAPEPPAVHGLPLGDPAPDFELPDLQGDRVSLLQLRSGGKPVLLLFAHPGCGPCQALLPEVASWQRDSADSLRIVVISEGSREDNLAKARQHGIETVLLQTEHEIGNRYDALATPSAVLVRPDGTIGSAAATGAEAIRSLVANTINESMAGLVAEPLHPGAAAPPLVYPDLNGRMFNLSQLRGRPGILLFWNPGCGFCQQMTDDLKSWEKKAAKAGTQVVLISTGTVEANAKQGFRSPILLDENFSAGKAFGVTGTPSALLLDEESRSISKVAVGKQEILDTVFSLVRAAAEQV
jgi:methylamine dehydrogenase accessory protein MauD